MENFPRTKTKLLQAFIIFLVVEFLYERNELRRQSLHWDLLHEMREAKEGFDLHQSFVISQEL